MCQLAMPLLNLKRKFSITIGYWSQNIVNVPIDIRSHTVIDLISKPLALIKQIKKRKNAKNITKNCKKNQKLNFSKKVILKQDSTNSA